MSNREMFEILLECFVKLSDTKGISEEMQKNVKKERNALKQYLLDRLTGEDTGTVDKSK